MPSFIGWLLAAALAWVAVRGLRGVLAIRDAMDTLDFERLASPPEWRATRLLAGALTALLAWLCTAWLGLAGTVATLALGGLGFFVAPRLLLAARRQLEQQLLDELAVHFDLLAVALEAGSSWSVALALCIERAPQGPLRRAWGPVLADIRRGVEPLDALRTLEQRLRLQPFTTLVSALRAAEKLQRPAAQVLRDRARHCATARFARAERRARAAPLKLWAALWLCLAPGTAVVLAFPLARLLASLAG